MTIKNKIQLGSIALIFFTGIISATFILIIRAEQRASVEVKAISQVMSETVQLYIATNDYVQDPAIETQSQWQAKYTAIGKFLSQPVFNNYRNEKSFQEIEKSYNTIQTLFSQINQASQNEKLQERLTAQILVHSKNLASGASELTQFILTNLEHRLRLSVVIIFISTVFLLAITVSISLFLIQKVLRPIIALEKDFLRISTLDFSTTTTTIGNNSNDEIGMLSRAFNTMSLKLKAYYVELERKVKERTLALDQKVEELEKLNRVMIGRELKMIELKKLLKQKQK